MAMGLAARPLRMAPWSADSGCGRSNAVAPPIRTMPDLTRREAQLLEAFEQHVERTGRVPSRTELQNAMGWQSLGTVQYFLNRLASKGAIELVHGDSAGRGPGRSPSATSDIPILGRIAADSELLADENIEDTVSASTAVALFRIRTDFLLRVPDDSMAGSGIHAGDLVAVQKATDARPGSLVVVRVAGEVTLRRLHHDNGRTVLVPDRPDFQRGPPDDEQFQIEGIVVGSLRHRSAT